MWVRLRSPLAALVPTFATSGAISFAQGDLLRLSGPATADTTFAGFACTIVTQEV
jgi:hypothetical protein